MVGVGVPGVIPGIVRIVRPVVFEDVVPVLLALGLRLGGLLGRDVAIGQQVDGGFDGRYRAVIAVTQVGDVALGGRGLGCPRCPGGGAVELALALVLRGRTLRRYPVIGEAVHVEFMEVVPARPGSPVGRLRHHAGRHLGGNHVGQDDDVGRGSGLGSQPVDPAL